MTQSIPVPEPVTGWWPTYYESFQLPAGVTLEITGRARIPAVAGLRVPVTLSMVGAGTSKGDFELRVPPTLGFSGPPPVAANLVIPAGIRFSVDAADRYMRTFGLTVSPRLAVNGTLAVLPPVPGAFGLKVAPKLTIAGRAYHAPELFTFTASNASWGIPDWCDAFDEIALGGGGGGLTGTGGNNHGRGGAAGSWASRTVERGTGAGQLARQWNTLNIVVGQDTPASNHGQASSTNVVGNGGWGVNGAAGNAGGSPNQYGKVPGPHTFNGVKYQGPPGAPGLTDIPANGANYSGWTGCGDGNLGGIGTGGAGGRGALISGGDPGGNGCGGRVFVYCYQSQDAASLPPAARQTVVFQNSFYYPNANGGAFPAHAAGDILLVFAYVYAAGIPTIPALNVLGNIPAWQDLGSAPNGGGRLCWARATNANMNTGVWDGAYAIGVAVLRNAHQTRPIGGFKMINTSGVSAMTAPALDNLIGRPLGSSQIVHFFGSNSNSWGNLTAGFTARQQSTYIRIATKNDTTTSTDVTTSPTNGTYANSTAVSVEIMGASV